MIDHLEVELDLLDTQLARIARGQPGCQALQRRYGVGWLTAVAIWAEFGDVRRFANSRQAVRFCGLDITISESDGKRTRGHLARQGAPVLRWALHEGRARRAATPTPIKPAPLLWERGEEYPCPSDPTLGDFPMPPSLAGP
jgi:transposase